MNEENNKENLNQSTTSINNNQNIFQSNNNFPNNNLNSTMQPNNKNNIELNSQQSTNNINTTHNESIYPTINNPAQNIYPQPNNITSNISNIQDTTNITNQASTNNLNELEKTNIINSDNSISNNPQNNIENNPYQNNSPNQIATNEPDSQNEIKPPSNKKNPKKLIIIIGSVIVISAIATITLTMLSKNLSTKNNSTQKAQNNLNNYERNEAIAVPNDEEKYGFIDLEGNKVSEFIYDSATDFYNGYALVTKDDTNYIIDSNFQKVMDTTELSYHNSTYNRWIIDTKLYNEKLKQISEYDNIKGSLDNKLVFESSSNCNCSGIMDYNGKIIYKEDGYIKFNTSEYSNDYVVMNKDNKYAILSLETGKIVLEYQNYRIESEKNNNFIMETDNRDKTIYIEDDKIILEYNGEAEINYSDEYNGILKIDADDDIYCKYFYKKTEEIFDSDDDIYEKYNLEMAGSYLKSEGYYVFYSNGKKGIKKDGEIILEAKYYSITFPSEEEFSYAKQKNIEPVELIINDEIKKTIIYDLKNKETLFEVDKHYLMAPTGINTPYVNMFEKVCNIFNKKCTESSGINYLLMMSRNNYVEVSILDFNNYDLNTLTYDIYNKDMKKIYSYKKTVR